MLGPLHVSTADAYDNLGVAYKIKRNNNQAIENFMKSLSIKLEIVGPENFSLGNTYNNLGCVFDEKGQYDMAVEYYNKGMYLVPSI